MNNSSYTWFEKDALKLLQFKSLLSHSDEITHCFTTRLGGVSEGECYSLNLGFNRNDSKENVLENYKRLCDALDIDIKSLVLSRQVHDNKIYKVSAEDTGKGIFKENDLLGYDGLMTNERNITLVTFYADCVPLFFYDPENNAIALSHSGWRSTQKQIAAETIRAMHREYGTDKEKLICAIGPSIRKCCFEVGEEVVEAFNEDIPWSGNFCEKKDSGKWHIDLQGIIKKTLMNVGIPENNISDAQICTKCNKHVFFSHRGDKGKTGSMTAVMQLL
jgi:YfiH family protein